ncbi:MAG: High-affinity branched-chain amino acid transport system permease protein LivH, partial [uncultured Thermomicrobiales bacterium]
EYSHPDHPHRPGAGGDVFPARGGLEPDLRADGCPQLRARRLLHLGGLRGVVDDRAAGATRHEHDRRLLPLPAGGGGGGGGSSGADRGGAPTAALPAADLPGARHARGGTRPQRVYRGDLAARRAAFSAACLAAGDEHDPGGAGAEQPAGADRRGARRVRADDSLPAADALRPDRAGGGRESRDGPGAGDRRGAGLYPGLRARRRARGAGRRLRGGLLRLDRPRLRFDQSHLRLYRRRGRRARLDRRERGGGGHHRAGAAVRQLLRHESCRRHLGRRLRRGAAAGDRATGAAERAAGEGAL